MQNKLLWLDYGVYRVTRTIRIPPGAKIVGESFPVIMSSGGWFDSATVPRAVVQVGRQGEKGRAVEMSDFLVATQGRQRGAVGIEWNLRTDGGGGEVSGMWDVHVRIGGGRGTGQGVGECVKRPGSSVVQGGCVAAFMAMWITKGAGRVVLENVWLWWVLLLCLYGERANGVIGRRTMISTIRRIRRLRCTRDGGCVSRKLCPGGGRNLLTMPTVIESTDGPLWLYGTGSEHHVLYQYQLVGTQNIFMGQIQTETPYVAFPFISNPN